MSASIPQPAGGLCRFCPLSEPGHPLATTRPLSVHCTRCNKDLFVRRGTRIMSFTKMHMYFDDIEVGQVWESLGRTVTESDIVNFAGLSGDFNPIHIDHEFAKTDRKS